MLKKVASGTVLTVLLIIILTLPCSIQPVKAGPGNLIATCGEGYLEEVNGVLVLHVKGSPYEMGYQNGFLLKDDIQTLIQYIIQERIQNGYSYDYLVNCAQAMEPHIPQEYIQEMQGLADGASMNYTDVLLEQIICDIKFYGTGWNGTGCSGFVVFGNSTMDGHLYHGRSFDSSIPPDEPVGLITVYEPENGNAFVNAGYFGFIGVHTGMNKKGITLENNISSSSDKTLDGMPIMFIGRKVLQYANNLTEAIDIICQADRTTGHHILLGDGKNLNACALEISDDYCKVFWAGDPAEDIEPHYSIPNVVRRTNHYVDPELAATQRSPYDPRVAWNWSWNRYDTLTQLIEDNYGNITAETSIEFLRTPPVAWAEINLQSVVFDSTELELWVADAAFNTPAYEREFIYLSYDDLFSPYTPDVPDAPDGCFIATAAYGTPMADEIQTLRDFTDEYLLTNPLGQALVDIYYKLSPPIAEFITEHPFLKPIVRAGLVPAVVMSTVVVNTTPAEKAAIVGLLALVSAALAIWAMKRRGRGPEYN